MPRADEILREASPPLVPIEVMVRHHAKHKMREPWA